MLRSGQNCAKILVIGVASMTLNRLCKFIAAAALVLMSTAAAHTDRRVALVIGKGAYKNTPALANPATDAEDITVALQGAGFDVIVGNKFRKRFTGMGIARIGTDVQA